MIGSIRGFRATGAALTAGLAIVTAAGLAVPAYAAPAPAPTVAQPRQTAAPLAAKKSAIHIGPTHLDLGHRRVGTFLYPQTTVISNTGTLPLVINAIKFVSGTPLDFTVGTDCFPDRRAHTLAPGESCLIKAVFTPRAFGRRVATLSISDSAKSSPHLVKLNGVGTLGYFMTGVEGGVATFGDALFKGEMKGNQINEPIVSINPTSGGSGYWLTGSDGGVFAFGTAGFFGSTGARRLTRPMVGMSILRKNSGYWLVGSDGGVFAFGKAKFYGSTGGMHLNQPIVGMASTGTGKGYWLVARDGGVFTFGDAKFYGSTGGIRLAQPIVGMARTKSGRGYWLVAADGGVFTFGDARFFGSAAGQGFGAFVGIAPSPDGNGYWLSNSVGQVFNFGNAPYFGDVYRRGIRDARGVASSAPQLRAKAFKGVFNFQAVQLNSRLAAAARERVNLP